MIGAIDETQHGPGANRSVQDAVLRLLTPAETRLSGGKTGYKKTGQQPLPTRPTLVANDIDRAFNTVRHKCLNEVMTEIGFASYVLNSTHDVCTNRTLSYNFQGEIETSQSFELGLPQGSPRAAVLFSIDCTPIIPKSSNPNKIN